MWQQHQVFTTSSCFQIPAITYNFWAFNPQSKHLCHVSDTSLVDCWLASHQLSCPLATPSQLTATSAPCHPLIIDHWPPRKHSWLPHLPCHHNWLTHQLPRHHSWLPCHHLTAAWINPNPKIGSRHIWPTGSHLFRPVFRRTRPVPGVFAPSKHNCGFLFFRIDLDLLVL